MGVTRGNLKPIMKGLKGLPLKTMECDSFCMNLVRTPIHTMQTVRERSRNMIRRLGVAT
jgi:hypothetical protein